MPAKKVIARVHDADLVNMMADIVDRRKTAVRQAVGCKAASAESLALKDAADLVTYTKELGYSQQAAEGLLNQGAARSHNRAAMVNGKTASDTPTLPSAHVKFDGPKDRRRQRRQDEAIGNKYTIPTAFWEAENAGGVQEASLKLDAADTGEWFG